MRTRKILVTLGIVALSLPVVAQTVDLRPGKYEVTAEMEMAGFPMKPQKDLDCVTAEHLKDLSRLLVRDGYAEGCKVSDVKTTGNKMTFNTTCEEDGTRYTSSSELTFAVDSYTGLMKMKLSDGRVTTIKMSGKRIGECTK